MRALTLQAREGEARRAAAVLAAADRGAPSVGELMATLVGLMETGESVLEAIQRRGSGATSRRFDARSKRESGGAAPAAAAAEQARRREVETITEAASGLLGSGMSGGALGPDVLTIFTLEVYERTREELQRLIDRQIK